MASETTIILRKCLERMQAGDATARDELIGRACERLRRLAHAMLPGYFRLRRWMDTDDVLQNVLVRLMRALQSVQPETLEHFFRLAAMHMRHELIDLSRKFYGPEGAGTHEKSDPPRRSEDSSSGAFDPSQSSADQQRLTDWTAFHEQLEQLPAEQRSVCELVWYHGFTQLEAAEVLNLSEAKVRRAWVSARLQLRDALRGEMPQM